MNLACGSSGEGLGVKFSEMMTTWGLESSILGLGGQKFTWASDMGVDSSFSSEHFPEYA